ncbi:MAG TPA: type VI secretion system protein TssL, partial [Methylococcaceae bacterium]|nr:type VI secretion system protein TssL [Methylococcaceae bacterium]
MSVDDMTDIKQKALDAKIEAIDDQAEVIKGALAKEMTEGLVFIEREGLKIIIRINEKGSFPSGGATLKVGFEPVMAKITTVVNDSNGIVHVAGHTDNIPIATDWFRSNWELSASRAVTVAHF